MDILPLLRNKAAVNMAHIQYKT